MTGVGTGTGVGLGRRLGDVGIDPASRPNNTFVMDTQVASSLTVGEDGVSEARNVNGGPFTFEQPTQGFQPDEVTGGFKADSDDHFLSTMIFGDLWSEEGGTGMFLLTTPAAGVERRIIESEGNFFSIRELNDFRYTFLIHDGAVFATVTSAAGLPETRYAICWRWDESKISIKVGSGADFVDVAFGGVSSSVLTRALTMFAKNDLSGNSYAGIINYFTSIDAVEPDDICTLMQKFLEARP